MKKKRPTQLPVYLEKTVSGIFCIHLPSLPGLFAYGRTEKSALATLRKKAVSYHLWFRKDRRPVKIPKKLRLQIVERKSGTGLNHSGGEAAFFLSDFGPPTKPVIRLWEKILQLGRKEVLRLVANLSPKELDWRPKKNKRSVREVLLHLANAEWWYASRIVLNLSTAEIEWSGQDPFKRLKVARRIILREVKNFPSEKAGQVFTPPPLHFPQNRALEFAQGLAPLSGASVRAYRESAGYGKETSCFFG